METPTEKSERSDAHTYRLLQAQWLIDEYKRRRGVAPENMEEMAEELADHEVVTPEEVHQVVEEYERLRHATSLSLTEQMRLAELQQIMEPNKSKLDRP